MNFLNVDFAKGTTALFKEAFKFKKYKAMPIFFAIVVGICQLGFAIASFVVAGLIYVFDFFKKLFALPIEYLHGVVRNEKDEVKAGAQTVIYLISWPVIFLAHMLLVALVLLLNILYIVLALATFVWTLGGFRFHLLLNDSCDIEKNVEGKYNKIALIAFIIGILAIIILLPLVLVVIHYLGLTELDRIYLFKNAGFKILLENIIFTVKTKVIVAFPIADAFIFIYTLVAFIPFPRAKKVAPVIVEAEAEAAQAEEALAEEAEAAEAEAEEAPVEEAEAAEAEAEEAPVEEAEVAEAEAEEAPVEEEAPASAE